MNDTLILIPLHFDSLSKITSSSRNIVTQDSPRFTTILDRVPLPYYIQNTIRIENVSPLKSSTSTLHPDRDRDSIALKFSRSGNVVGGCWRKSWKEKIDSTERTKVEEKENWKRWDIYIYPQIDKQQ